MALPILALIGVLFWAGYYAALYILNLLITYLTTNFKVSIIALSPYESILNILKIDTILVLVVTLPLLLAGTIYYILPALYKHERKFLSYIPAVFFLAVTGLCFGTLLSLKLFLPYLQRFTLLLPVANNWSLSGLISFILTGAISFMLMFQLPLVILTLIDLKILKLKNLNVLRKAFVLIAVIFGGVITPSVDIVSQLIVALPFYLLFELTIQYYFIRQKFF